MHYCCKGQLYLLLRLMISSLRSLGKQKIVCIGCYKTGTTSLAKALSELGIIVGVQRLGEVLVHDWARGDFRRLFWYCRSAQAFQDVPFSLPFTFQALDQKFPNSRFILTLRDSAEQWYESLTRFNAAKFGNGRLPTAEELKNSTYVYPGFAYQVNRLLRNTPENDLYKKSAFIADYIAHNAAVMEYFRHRSKDLLILNVAEAGAYQKLCDFLGKSYNGRAFPWENKTAELLERLTS